MKRASTDFRIEITGLHLFIHELQKVERAEPGHDVQVDLPQDALVGLRIDAEAVPGCVSEGVVGALGGDQVCFFGDVVAGRGFRVVGGRDFHFIADRGF